MSAPTYQFITVAVGDDGVAELRFDRPEVNNAVHLPMNREIRAALEVLAADERVRALILTGSGDRAFVSGADIGELLGRRSPVALEAHNAKLCDAIEAFPCPTVAAIRGWALGGGCEVALACDMRVAGRSARLGQPEVSLGILPAAGGTWRLPRVVGLAKAKELIFTARVIDADEALAIGLVNHVTDDDAVLAKAHELAASCARQSRLALRLAKLAIDQGREASQATGRALEALGQALLYDDTDKHERMTAFLDRRTRKTRDGAAGDAGEG